MIKARKLMDSDLPTSACLGIFFLNTHPTHENHRTAMDPFNPADVFNIYYFLREINLLWKSLKHLFLLSVTCSLRLSKF